MARMKKQKLFASGLALVMLLALLVSCGGKAEEVVMEEATFEPDRFNPEGTFPIIKERVTISMGVVQDTNVENWETNRYTQKLEEALNVDLVFESFPPPETSAKEKLAILISSGSDLPDVINILLSDIEAYTYGSQGYFIDLTPYIENSSYYLTKNVDLDKYMKYIRSADGNIYSMPRIIEEVGNDWSYRQWINQTWLDELGLEMPTTTDEYYEVLKAFKTQDPNGNGLADEIPLVGSTNGWNSHVWKTLLNAFIYSNPDNGYLLSENGTISVAYNQEAYKDGLEYIHKLYAEDLLSPLTFTQDTNQLKTILEDQDAQLVGSLAIGSMSVYQPESLRKRDIVTLPPLEGPDGFAYATLTTSSLPGLQGFITSSCEDPEAAFKVLDYMYDTETAMHGRFGEKDVDWQVPAAGSGVGLYESLGYMPSMEYINSLWGTLQNVHWSERHVTYRSYEMSGGQLWSEDPYDSQYMTAQSVPHYLGKADDEAVLKILYLPEEVDQIADILATLGTYRDEMSIAFITGNKPFSEWDSYVEELNKIGLEEYIEVTQVAFDRMNGK